jgi:hypothetical protein
VNSNLGSTGRPGAVPTDGCLALAILRETSDQGAKFEFGNPLERGQRIHGNAFDSRPTHVLIITPEEKTAV